MRMLSKFVSSAALGSVLAIAAPVHAEDTTKQSFTHDGYTYEYEVTEAAYGKVIHGRRFPGAISFDLAVKGDKVSGFSGGQPISFQLKDAVGAAGK